MITKADWSSALAPDFEWLGMSPEDTGLVGPVTMVVREGTNPRFMMLRDAYGNRVSVGEVVDRNKGKPLYIVDGAP